MSWWHLLFSPKISCAQRNWKCGKWEGWWKSEVALDKHTFIREMTKLCEIIVLLQLNKGVSNPPRVLLVEGFLEFELCTLRREGEDYLWHYISTSANILKAVMGLEWCVNHNSGVSSLLLPASEKRPQMLSKAILLVLNSPDRKPSSWKRL